MPKSNLFSTIQVYLEFFQLVEMEKTYTSTSKLKGEKLINCGIGLGRNFLLRVWSGSAKASQQKRKTQYPYTGSFVRSAYLSMFNVIFMLKSALSRKHDGPRFAFLSLHEINSLGSVGERRTGPVPSAHMFYGVVQIRIVAHTQPRPYFVNLLRFLLGASLPPGSRRTKPNRCAFVLTTPQIRIIQALFSTIQINSEDLDQLLTPLPRIQCELGIVSVLPALTRVAFPSIDNIDMTYRRGRVGSCSNNRMISAIRLWYYRLVAGIQHIGG